MGAVYEARHEELGHPFALKEAFHTDGVYFYIGRDGTEYYEPVGAPSRQLTRVVPPRLGPTA